MPPAPRRFELEDAVSRPGTYFNPATEMLLIVDDSASVDAEIFDDDSADDTQWVLLGDSGPIDETTRDELIERFATRHGSGPTGAVAAGEDDEDELDDLDDLGAIDDPEEDDDPYASGGFDEPDAFDEDADY